MKIVVISSSNDIINEHQIVEQMFNEGLQNFHIRKPYITSRDMKRYIQSFNPEYWNRLILHTYFDLCPKYNLKGVHLSRRHRKTPLKTWLRVTRMKLSNPDIHLSYAVHNPAKLKYSCHKYNYVFLSPIFDSITKKSYKSAFDYDDLVHVIPKIKENMIALGGVDYDKIDIVRKMGFSGVALLGALWENKDPLAQFIKIKEKCYEEEFAS